MDHGEGVFFRQAAVQVDPAHRTVGEPEVSLGSPGTGQFFRHHFLGNIGVFIEKGAPAAAAGCLIRHRDVVKAGQGLEKRLNL